MNEIYRDPKEGALARRIDLLRRRRDELVTMPHAIRRVAVARGARSAAALTAILTGALTLAVAASTRLADTVASVLPGPGPAPIATFAAVGWLVSVMVYIAARAMHEHRFVVAMSRYVLPGEDVDVDLERLSHERPDDMAREMAHRLEVRSAALPVAAAAMVVPPLVVYIALAVSAHGWASTSAYEEALAAHVVALFAIADAGLVTAIAMTRRSMRLPVVAPIAASITAIVGTTALVAFSRHAFAPAWWALGAFAITGSIAIVVRRLQSERERIETDDPAAGSDMFTWRGFVRDMRAVIAWIRTKLTRRQVRRAIGAVAVIAAAAFGYHTLHARERAAAPQLAVAPLPVPSPHKPAITPAASTYVLSHQDGRLLAELQLIDGQPIDIGAFPRMPTVPPGWRARVTVTSSGDTPVEVTPFPRDPSVAKVRLLDTKPHTFEICATDTHEIGLHVDSLAKDTDPKQVTLALTATLELADCKDQGDSTSVNE